MWLSLIYIYPIITFFLSTSVLLFILQMKNFIINKKMLENVCVFQLVVRLFNEVGTLIKDAPTLVFVHILDQITRQ